MDNNIGTIVIEGERERKRERESTNIFYLIISSPGKELPVTGITEVGGDGVT